MSDIQDEAYSEACDEIERLKALLTRAADALEGGASVKDFDCTKRLKLIQELRKAACEPGKN